MNRHSLVRPLPAVLAIGLLWWSGPAAAQDASCRGGWTTSCAAVEVVADADRLIFFSPNAAAPVHEDAAVATGAPSSRVRVLADRPGETCHAATSAGCEDVTWAWTSSEGSAAVAADPGNASCREDEVWMARARGMEEDENRCRRSRVGAFFLVALPTALYVLGPDGDDPVTEHPELGGPAAGLPDPGDQGDGGGDSTGGDSGGSSSGGDTGGDSSGGDTGGDSSGGNDGGDSSGGDGGGNSSGGDDGGPPGGSGPGGGLGLPPETRPPMSEVPEPVSTTLFGLGLAGYASARLRKRRAERLRTGGEIA